MEHEIFDTVTTVIKRHVPNQSEISESVSWIFGNLFFSLCGILDVKKYFCHTAN